MIVKINKYILSFDESSIKYQLFETQQYYGILFLINNDKYEIIHNKDIGTRLLINKEYFWNDIPFKKDTFNFLPFNIKCEEA